MDAESGLVPARARRSGGSGGTLQRAGARDLPSCKMDNAWRFGFQVAIALLVVQLLIALGIGAVIGISRLLCGDACREKK